MGAAFKNVQILITDLSGRVVQSITMDQIEAHAVDIALEKPAGIYFVSIQAGNKKAYLRLVKE